MYEFSEGLKPLKIWLARNHVDVDHIKTERQVLYFASKLSGTIVKFPPREKSCFPLLLEIQKKIETMKPKVKRPKFRKFKKGRAA